MAGQDPTLNEFSGPVAIAKLPIPVGKTGNQHMPSELGEARTDNPFEGGKKALCSWVRQRRLTEREGSHKRNPTHSLSVDFTSTIVDNGVQLPSSLACTIPIIQFRRHRSASRNKGPVIGAWRGWPIIRGFILIFQATKHSRSVAIRTIRRSQALPAAGALRFTGNFFFLSVSTTAVLLSHYLQQQGLREGSHKRNPNRAS